MNDSIYWRDSKGLSLVPDALCNAAISSGAWESQVDYGGEEFIDRAVLLLRGQAQGAFKENNDLVLKAAPVALRCSNEGLVQGLREAQAEVLNGFFSLNLAHVGKTLANLMSAGQVRPGSLTVAARAILDTHWIRTYK